MKRITLLVSILLLLFSACSEEAREGGSIEKNGEMLLMLDLKVPVSSSTTRALDKDKEDKVQTVDVLVFDEAGIYQYRKSADVTDASFKVYLKKSGEDKHRLVVLANLKNEINSIDPDLTDGTFGVSQHTQKEDILKLITFESTGNWDTDNLAYTALPMWGETVAKEISASTPSNSFGTIYLLRAVARIDVGLDFDQGSNLPQGLSNFVLKSVEIRNSYSQGYAAPLTGKWSSTPEDRLPSIPDPVPAINEDGSKPVYSISDSETGKYGFVHEIYVSEYDNKTAADNDARFCLIIGGLYAGASAPTYYRIDLLDAQNAPLDILRNYHYRINITRVNGPGYGSEDTAFGSEPINMETDVYAWEEGGLNDIESDGQYQLAVDRSSLTLYKEGEPAETVNLYVDHPSGWEIEIPQAYEDWLRVSPESGDAKQPVSIAVTATAMTNAADPDRDGYFYIKSGRLKKKITVQQLNSQELSIVVTPSELVFRKSGTPAQTVEIATYPSDATRYFTYIGDFGTTWPWKPADGAADATYSVQPPVNGTGQTRTCVVTVHIKDATGVIIAARNFTVKQLATDINFVPTVDALYPAEGGQQQFLVTTDLIDWIMEITDDPKSILSNLDVTQQGPCTDQAYTFELTPNDTYALREAIIKVSSSESDFADRNIVIKQGYNAPAFTDVSASSITLDGTATQTLTFKVNAPWKFETAGDFDKVVATSGIKMDGNPITESTEYAGGTATVPESVTLTLYPNTANGGNATLNLSTVAIGVDLDKQGTQQIALSRANNVSSGGKEYEIGKSSGLLLYSNAETYCADGWTLPTAAILKAWMNSSLYDQNDSKAYWTTATRQSDKENYYPITVTATTTFSIFTTASKVQKGKSDVKINVLEEKCNEPSYFSPEVGNGILYRYPFMQSFQYEYTDATTLEQRRGLLFSVTSKQWHISGNSVAVVSGTKDSVYSSEKAYVRCVKQVN
ncbi:BACON domain-containing protein [Bacteroides sp. 224]|uniref:BACON domain-containing protein n=1 Tax=Bacteroides sp. 224 TaxID=2302936 RepID=UPI0013D2B2E3|nr:BACON domain-containing carbohydrate-binding protein [Bacteroides sp. 224]NDV66223.1 hypothetical protein [Bacteroides sp. 224]